MGPQRPWIAPVRWFGAASLTQRATLALTAVGASCCVYAAAYLLGFDIRVPGLPGPTATPTSAATPRVVEASSQAAHVETLGRQEAVRSSTRSALSRRASRAGRPVQSPGPRLVQPRASRSRPAAAVVTEASRPPAPAASPRPAPTPVARDAPAEPTTISSASVPATPETPLPLTPPAPPVLPVPPVPEPPLPLPALELPPLLPLAPPVSPVPLVDPVLPPSLGGVPLLP